MLKFHILDSVQYYLRWLLSAAEGVRGRIVLRALVGMIHVSMSMLFVWTCKQLIDIATSSADGDLWFFVGLLVLYNVMQILLSTIVSRLETQTEVVLKNSLRHRLFTHVMDSRWDGGERMHTGDVMNRLLSDVDTIANTLCVTTPQSIVTCVQFMLAFGFLIILDHRLALVVVLILPMFMLFGRAYVRRIRKYTKDIRQMDSRVQTHIQESMRHRVLVSTMEHTPIVKSDLETMQSDLHDMVMRRTDYTLFSRRMVQAGFAFGYMITFLWGIFSLRDGVITFGVMTAFLQLVGQIQRPVLDLSHQLPAFIHISTSVDRLTELMNLPLEEQGESVTLSGQVGVRLSDVEFAYPSNRERVFNGFSHDFEPGSLTAILGRTGAGKSTLIKIILGLLSVQRGKVEIYNHSQAVDVSALTRCNVAYVPQGNSLISGTIRSNLLLGNPSATDEQLREALHTAVADFVLELTEGMDTLCGEGGAMLSEGQAQRIAIARALLRERSVILLDEPTAALDVDTEQLLLERLGRYAHQRTLIVVTHHEVTATLCNAVVRVG